jgi:hypothetical protein
MFKDVADILLNKTVLMIGEERWKIFELEFYVNDYQEHADTFATVHNDSLGTSNGKWLIRQKCGHCTLELTFSEAIQR